MKWYPHGPALTTGEPKINTVTCKPNQHFFLQSVTFQVEDELFQIPDAVLPASETFQMLYPTILDENTPVVLGDCTKAQFEAFLTLVLQPCCYMFSAKHPCNRPPSLEVLLPALELASKWKFHELSCDIAYHAGRLITSPVQMVALGRQYTILSWYRPGIEKLVTSDDDITIEDAEQIGFPFALRVYHARARYARGMHDKVKTDRTVLSEIIEDMFADELSSHFTARKEFAVIDSFTERQWNANTTRTVMNSEPCVAEAEASSNNSQPTETMIGLTGEDGHREAIAEQPVMVDAGEVKSFGMDATDIKNASPSLTVTCEDAGAQGTTLSAPLAML